jgi:dTDP-4-dehydrorhamnose 3,5-epimerase
MADCKVDGAGCIAEPDLEMSMQVVETRIPEVKLITPKRHGDHRGYFSETYNARAMREAGIALDFVQDNQSLSAERGTIRGLHFQLPPFAQDKLVRVLRGSIFDVAVDLRRGSPTFGQHVSAVLTADEGNQLLVPIGFGHGFCTLEPDTEVFYKVTNYYSPECDRGLLWNDADLGIDWPVSADEAVLSQKDLKQPTFKELMEGLDAFQLAGA